MKPNCNEILFVVCSGMDDFIDIFIPVETIFFYVGDRLACSIQSNFWILDSLSMIAD